MMIQLSEELERFVRNEVRAGRYAREDDVVRDALTRLRESLPKEAAQPRRPSKATRPKKRLTAAEVHQRMLASGILTQLPNPAEDIADEDDPPITIKGEPLSETIIRERR